MNRMRETGRGMSLANNVGPAALTNSAAVTTLYSQLVKGNSLGPFRIIDIQFVGQLTTGALPPALTLTLTWGTASLVILNAIALATNTTAGAFRVAGQIIAQDATNAQFVWADCRQAGAASPMTGGNLLASGVWSLDTTLDQTLSVTAQFASASANATLIAKFFSFDIS